MYREHFGLETLPFKITPDPAFLCPTSQNRRALSLLRSDPSQRGPVIVVTGDVGTGKTTLILHILDDIPECMTIGLLSNFPGWADDILPWVLYTFEIPDAPDDAARMEAFESFVRREHAAGRKCVLIVDEAQNVSAPGLEQLCRLLTVNSGRDVQFMVVLVGQNELHETLKSEHCADLVQRIGVSVTLGPMNAAETERYIRHRLTVAGGQPEIFDREAVDAVHRISGGYPRLVNVVCDTAMVMAYGSGDHVIGRDLIAALGQKDSALSHVPDIARNARQAMAAETGGIVAPTASGPTEFEGAQPTYDEFEFATMRRPDVWVEAVEEPAPEPVRTAQVRQAAALPETAGAVPPASPASQREPGGQAPGMASPAGKPRSRRKPRGSGKAEESRRLAGGISFRRVLGGTVAGGVVAAGALFLAPLPLPEGAMTEPREIVSMQSVAALAPVALSRGNTPRPVPLKDMSGEAFLDRALSVGVTDPAAAAIDYARAAIRGERLAAYYLGQLHETGDGVAHDLALARSWYMSVEESVRGARRRLDDLDAPVRTGSLVAPRPLLGGTLDTGGAEFVWSSGEGSDPAFFVVELSDGPASTIRRLPPLEISALKVDDIGDARFWRVFAVAPDINSYAVSGWRALGETDTGATLGTDGVASEAWVHLPMNANPQALAELTDVLSASDIPYRIENSGSRTAPTDGLQIGYHFQADENAARKIADAVGARSAVMLAHTPDPDRAGPFPGQVLVLPADR